MLNFRRKVLLRLIIPITYGYLWILLDTQFQEEGLIEKEMRIERESIEAGDEGEMRHTEL